MKNSASRLRRDARNRGAGRRSWWALHTPLNVTSHGGGGRRIRLVHLYWLRGAAAPVVPAEMPPYQVLGPFPCRRQAAAAAELLTIEDGRPGWYSTYVRRYTPSASEAATRRTGHGWIACAMPLRGPDGALPDTESLFGERESLPVPGNLWRPSIDDLCA